MDKISEKLHFSNHQPSAPPAPASSSDSEDEKKPLSSPPTSSFGSKVRRLFGRERPVHKVFGGGKREFCFLTSALCWIKKIELERILLVQFNFVFLCICEWIFSFFFLISFWSFDKQKNLVGVRFMNPPFSYVFLVVDYDCKSSLVELSVDWSLHSLIAAQSAFWMFLVFFQLYMPIHCF